MQPHTVHGHLLGTIAFVRLPLIAWQAPRTLRSDMSGFSQLGLFGGMIIGGGAETMKIMSRTNMMSMNGVTLISCMARDDIVVESTTRKVWAMVSTAVAFTMRDRIE